jgi:CBF1 interacting corepressor
MSLSFLGKKSFHPSAPQNVAKLFEAEEKKRNEERKKEELAREVEREETRKHAARLLKKGEDAGPPSEISFLYAMPPGMKEAQARGKAKEAAEKSRAERDAERHPLLKNAPTTGDYTTNIEVSHQPFGVAATKFKGLRCQRCGAYGHCITDRECPLFNVPSELDDARKRLEDPKQAMRQAAGAEASGAALRWAPKAAPDMGMIGAGAGTGDSNQEFVVDFDEEEAMAAGAGGRSTMEDLDPSLLAMLDEKQRKELLKMYRRELREGGDEEGGGRGKHKSHKHKSHHKEHKHKSEKKRKSEKRSSDKGSKRRKHSRRSDSRSVSSSES